jgi:predicted metal-dependent phosphoesterase TrpH
MSPFDLHAHSTVSDGTLRPSALVERAVARGIDVLALTDHDDTAGTAEAVEAAAGSTVAGGAGVEISVTWESRTLHILGLNVDPCNAALAAGLAHIREGRDARAARIAESFAKAGIGGTLEGARKFVTSERLDSRAPILRRFLVTQAMRARLQGRVQALYGGRASRVTSSMLGSVGRCGCRGSRSGGGQAIVAHPVRYGLTATQNAALARRVSRLGRATELQCSAPPKRWRKRKIVRAARACSGCYASTGSDFHDPDESALDLGSLPPFGRWDSCPWWFEVGDGAGPRQAATVFFLSDRTGITAEMLGNSLLTQFEEFDFARVTIPFVDSPERVQEAIRTVNEAAAREAHRPLVISSVVDEAMSEEIRREANGLTLDLFQVFIQPLEAELGAKSSHAAGRRTGSPTATSTSRAWKRSTSRRRTTTARRRAISTRRR